MASSPPRCRAFSFMSSLFILLVTSAFILNFGPATAGEKSFSFKPLYVLRRKSAEHILLLFKELAKRLIRLGLSLVASPSSSDGTPKQTRDLSRLAPDQLARQQSAPSLVQLSSNECKSEALEFFFVPCCISFQNNHEKKSRAPMSTVPWSPLK